MPPLLATAAAFLAAQLIRLSPFIYQQMKPILFSASEDVWRHAYPLAAGFVKDLSDDGKIEGWDRHKQAVKQLEAAMLADGKFVVKGTLQVSEAVLGQIVLAAYTNSGL